jgi:hypothetical protein
MQNPVRAAQALVSATIRQLPLPPWLGEWLNTLATRMADLQRINGQMHEEVFAIGGLLQELSNLLQNLTSTFDEFTAQTARITELTTHVPVAMVELTEAAHHDNVMIGNIGQQITDLDTQVAQARGDLLELHQCVERHTSYVEDGELRLALNTILARISHLATADQVQELDQRLQIIEVSPLSPSPFRSPRSTRSLSPLPMSTLQPAFPLRSSSEPPPPAPALALDEDGMENEFPVTILPYDDALTRWADPEVLRSDLHIRWNDHTWKTGTYCGLSFEYFITRPDHAPRFVGLTHRCCRIFGNSKRAIGKLVGQEEGLAFSMSRV